MLNAHRSDFMTIKNVLTLFALLFFCCLQNEMASQDCGCTVKQVEENNVTPCDVVYGNIIEVSTVDQFRAAIAQANNNGGNMTILIADGTYPIASTASFPYITGDNIVFRSMSGNRDAVIITGQGMVPTSSTEDGFLIAGNGVVIADLTIRDVGNHGIQVSGANLIIHNVKIQDTYEQMFKGSSSADSIESGLIQCSLFEYTAGVGPNWYIGGIDIHKGVNWIVRDNVFKNIASPGDAIAEHAIHFWNNSMNNTIERNQIYNCDRGIGFGLGDNLPQNDGGIIRNNMIYNDGTGLFNDVGIGLESSPNTQVYNNTIFVNYPNAIEYRFPSSSNIRISNNLCNKAITSRNGGTATEETNFTQAEADWFIDVTSGNLRLASDHTALVDQGTTLSQVSDDIDQNVRPENLPFDIGASEWQTVSNLEVTKQVNIEISPNPTMRIININSGRDLSQAQMSIYNANGKLILQRSQLNGNQFQFLIGTLPAGLYFVQIQENELVLVRKKIKVTH